MHRLDLWKSAALRGAVIATSLAAIVLAFAWTGRVTAIWNVTLAAVALFYALVHVVPRAIFRLQSMPYTYQLHRNWGPRGLELQNVTYAAYHTHWYNRATHAAFPLEAWLWLVVATHAGGPLASAALAAALSAQALSFGERRFALGLSALWLVFAASASAVVARTGSDAYAHAQLGLVALGFWRFSGHWVEPLPPGTVGNRSFVSLAQAAQPWRALPAAALGYLSEFSAGLPFRLVNSWFFQQAQSLGYRPERALPWAEAEAAAQRIHREGWGAQRTTAEIVEAARALEPGPERAGAPRASASSGPIRLLACDEGASVWLVAIGGRTLLFDAWLDDPYVSSSAAFFTGRRLEPPVVGAEALPPLDAIVLSSAEQDHAHPRTLARLDKRVPVYVSRAAARSAQRAGFAAVTILAPGEPVGLCGGAVSALALPGYGRNTAIVLRDAATGERLCIAPHGLDAEWLAAHAQRVFDGPFAPDAAGRLVDSLCLGVHTTRLAHRLLPAWLLGRASTIVPDPSDSAAAVARLAPRRVLFAHCTREAEQGFAVRHLLHYPSAADDVGYAKQVLGARCEGIAIEGLPAPAVWV
jgi:hypothetical protein